MNEVVEFPSIEVSDEERARRTMVEVDRLVRLSPNEWKFWFKKSAGILGIAPDMLSDLIEAKIKDIKAAERAAEAEKRRQDDRAERQRQKDAERKSKEKGKAFADIAKLPSDSSETKLGELATRFDEDPAALREEFSAYADTADTAATPSAGWADEPWSDPVEAAALLCDIIGKLNQHFAARHPHEVLTIALWIMVAWCHETSATYSAILMATSADIDSGKTTMLGAVGFLTPKPLGVVEATGPSIYRLIDAQKPTLVFDEADTIFKRKTDLAHIINNSWTRGAAKIPRTVRINGAYQTVFFDVFCPKAIGLLGLNVPRALVSRSIIIKAWPKRPEDKQTFNHVDDDVVAELRRKLTRWSADNATALKDATPLYPAGFNNRRQANWRLLLAIAELAGGQWPAQAREAAERISHTTRKPSFGLQLLAAMQKMFLGRTEITSEEVVAQLTSDPDSIWVAYKGGQITQRQVADLLDQYEIAPHGIHPTKRKDLTLRGYELVQFVDVFVRCVPSDPLIRTLPRKRKSSSRKKK